MPLSFGQPEVGDYWLDRVGGLYFVRQRTDEDLDRPRGNNESAAYAAEHLVHTADGAAWTILRITDGIPAYRKVTRLPGSRVPLPVGPGRFEITPADADGTRVTVSLVDATPLLICRFDESFQAHELRDFLGWAAWSSNEIDKAVGKA